MPLSVIANNIGDGALLYHARLPYASRVPAGVHTVYLLVTRLRVPVCDTHIWTQVRIDR